MKSASRLRARAEALRALHATPPLLVLPNVWDPIGARVLEAKGFPAVATASAAISSSLGRLDGERISRTTMLQVVAGIAEAVDVPVTADLEGGYADTLDELAEAIRELVRTGAVGLNLEDSRGQEVLLRPVEEQAERIATVRETAREIGVPLVVNARVDVFLAPGDASAGERFEQAAARAAAYRRAGADCIYPIGPADAETLAALRARIEGPLNALATPDAAPLPTLAAIGVNRVSFGPLLFRSCLRKFADIVDALARGDGYGCFGDEMLTRAEVAAYLREAREEEGARSLPLDPPSGGS